ncbi:hypothetical protein [Joostella sp.]|uniref:hypothetical protein n=1 Tax=Joostella sp. TaxID=2231138 RepID=UPI003A8D9E23
MSIFFLLKLQNSVSKQSLVVLIMLVTTIGFSQNNSKQDSLLLGTYSTTTQSNESDFNPFVYADKLETQLSPHIIRTYNIDEIRNGELTTYNSDLDKLYFKNSNKFFHDDLDKFIPKPPDFNSHYLPLTK